ncbi:hypothetical protein AYO49_01105 [Verrucomicrobiaceae bacterium SCGC AG-212-N21]|nr:hypothetical protein AYO49_01105 [Verrucomicrobiaceae bacterium SCGC AG-212-N21]
MRADRSHIPGRSPGLQRPLDEAEALLARGERTVEARTIILGLCNRRLRWGLTMRGWLALGCLGLLVLAVVFFSIQPFLALTHRQNTDVLVMEGWVNGYAVNATVEEFGGSPYRRIYVTGGPVAGIRQYVNDYQTSASVGADLLRKAGVAEHFVQMVPSRVKDSNRTYGAAVALRNWFRQQNISARSFNVVTEGPHARRTRLLYQKAFGREFNIGIIAVPSPDYDASHWWRYSEGVRDVLGEGIAYLYARFLFHAPTE